MKEQSNQPLDVEANFNNFVVSVRGQMISSLIPKDYNKNNADYYYPEHNVVAELKCFQKDLFNNKEDIPRIFEFFKIWKKKKLIKQGDEIKLIYKTLKLPDECFMDLINSAAKTIDRAIHKANKQIKESKNYLQKPDAKGLLLLCNDGNYFLENNTYVYLINNLMERKYMKSEIDALVFFTCNQIVSIPNSDSGYLYWIPSYRIDGDPVMGSFVDNLGIEFGDYFAKIIGEPFDKRVYKDFDEGIELIKGMKNLPKDIAYGKN